MKEASKQGRKLNIKRLPALGRHRDIAMRKQGPFPIPPGYRANPALEHPAEQSLSPTSQAPSASQGVDAET